MKCEVIDNSGIFMLEIIPENHCEAAAIKSCLMFDEDKGFDALQYVIHTRYEEDSDDR